MRQQIVIQRIPFCLRRRDEFIAVYQLRMVLIGFAVQKAIIPLEALGQRPVVIGSGGRYGIERSQMPFPDPECAVPLFF